MNGRAIAFVLLSSLIMMAAVILQNKFQPPIKPVDQAAEVVDAAGSDDETLLAETPLPTDNDEAGPETSESTNPTPTTDSEKLPTDADTIVAAEPQTAEEATPYEEPAPELRVAPVDRFVTLGSLAATSDSRFLITINQSGGTIHRVELNYRNKKNK